MDYETGKVLYQKNGNVKIYPASTTKAWTAYLVIKHVPDLNEKITIGNLPYIEPSSMFLKKGETKPAKDLSNKSQKASVFVFRSPTFSLR